MSHRRVLIVDDNPAIHADIRKILAPEPLQLHELEAAEAAVFGRRAATDVAVAGEPEFQIDSALQGEEGIAAAARARKEDRPYALAIVDARMPPGLDGIETIARLWQKDPDVLVVLCTAYCDYSWQEIRRRLPHPERLVVLKKPFEVIEVQQLAESLTEKWRLARTERERLRQLEGFISERNREVRSAQQRGPRFATSDRSAGASAATEQRRSAIAEALQRAMQENQFCLHYQPLVNITTRCAVGLEALLRWHHPQLGTVSPAEFIPVAEQIDLIVPIGDFVLRSVCAQIRRWEDERIPVVPVAVNVSPAQLDSPGIWSRIRQILKEEGVQPQHLVLEITESCLMENASRHAAALQALRADGIVIEIDDFGTGYSSLSCLKQLPLDALKIDRSFVTHLGTNHTDEAIVSAILAMARSLGLRVVAEGVETPAQLEVLGRHGCEIAQGYYFCAPIASDECRQLLVDLADRTSFTDTLRLRAPSFRPVGVPAQSERRSRAASQGLWPTSKAVNGYE